MENEISILVERLRETREYLGLSKQTVAEYVGVSETKISSIENGESKVESFVLEKMSKLYKYPVSYFSGTELPTDDKTVNLLARTAKGLNEADKQQLQKFAYFLRCIGRKDE
ncbi:helix-turn-helix domain-containing protein [Brevibacillus sp. HD1.4A]|uniref:helix-turn-helix domain-containing protein n=1 Tax=Brevibacillus sp. HD1.4A TaxID=2738978 RepID=UPI00156B1163|nr:helix-turn-helix transcriptional regulator [Brevibacillus sp. HD1.4A]NRQ56331.1 helix-turn-helix transcriptional regulator [Brevibacillus sp. HD1.4A]